MRPLYMLVPLVVLTLCLRLARAAESTGQDRLLDGFDGKLTLDWKPLRP
ncbi:MAG: hypothetical protein HUU20_24650, partial [Pirellulales bacterium]|nr:hypothetical protein [Pirellulales bacterium]